MYKLLVAATILTSAVNAQQYGGASGYGSSEGSKGLLSEGSYQAPKAEMESSYQAPKAEMGSSYQAPKAEYKPSESKPEMAAEPSKPCLSKEQGVHDVMVGGEVGLIYTPSSIMANVGDTVRFHFLMKNHTVTESTFDKPCVKKAGGTDSNFKPSALKSTDDLSTKGMDSSLMWEYKVEAMEPTWWYCKQRTGTHCGKGMVFAINPNAEKSFEKFKETAQMQNGTAEAGTPPPPKAESPPPPPSMQAGYNAGSGGACTCQCLCGTQQFPQGSEWGSGMTKGLPGVAEAPWGSMESKPAESKSGAPAAGGY